MIMSTKNVQGECQQCGGLFEFPAEAAGVVGECPHCGQQTECVLAAPPEERSPLRTKAIVFTVIALVILVGGLIAAQVAIKRAERMVGRKADANSSRPAEPRNPFAARNFKVTPVFLETTPGTKLVHARGTVQNLSNQQRFGVKVELELLDAAGKTLATTSDYVSVFEPKSDWNFHAPVTDPKTVSARVTEIIETK